MSSSGLGQVDENMGRAQQRDAAASGKFYFRKEVFSTVRSGTSSESSSSGASSPREGSPKKKEKKMKNCFPPPQLPEDGILNRPPVDEEYAEFTMNEIMNGKVRRSSWFGVNSFIKLVIRERTFQDFYLWWMITLILWRSIWVT